MAKDRDKEPNYDPNPSFETRQARIKALTPVQRRVFNLICERLKQTDVADQAKLSQPRVSEIYFQIRVKLQLGTSSKLFSWLPPTSLDEAETAAVELLLSYCEAAKSVPFVAPPEEPEPPPPPKPESAAPEGKVNSTSPESPPTNNSTDNIMNNLGAGNPAPLPARRIRWTWRTTAAVIVGTALVSGGIGAFISRRLAAPAVPAQPTQNAIGGVRFVPQTVEVPMTVVVPQTVEVTRLVTETLVATTAPQIIIITATPEPATSTPAGPTITPLPSTTSTSTPVPLALPFRDSFDSSRPEWRLVTGDRSYVQGKLTIVEGPLLLELPSAGNVQDYTVSYEYSFSSYAHIEVRLGPELKFTFDSHFGGLYCYLEVLEDNQWVNKTPSYLPCERTGNFSIKVSGRDYVLYASGQEIGRASIDFTGSRQPIGLYVTNEGGTTIDNFEVTAP